ncbi:hypothetical protein BS17DRAFT_776468 [Gyrodon lividus]|nr:hypothetical protein BS17DRAFT_776468 [Gyrodon lividus]
MMLLPMAVKITKILLLASAGTGSACARGGAVALVRVSVGRRHVSFDLLVVVEREGIADCWNTYVNMMALNIVLWSELLPFLQQSSDTHCPT